MGTLTGFGEAVMVMVIGTVLGALTFIVRSQLSLNKIFSEGIQTAMAEIKLLRLMGEEKETSRERSCGFHSEQIKELKTKTSRMDDDIIKLDENLNKHVIEYNHTKKK
jgi:hypothetical protein